MTRRMTADERAEMERMIAAGEDHVTIAAALGRHPVWVRRVMVERGVMLPERVHRSREDEDKMIELYGRGVGVKGIMRQFNISPTTFYRMLRRRGVELRGRGHYERV